MESAAAEQRMQTEDTASRKAELKAGGGLVQLVRTAIHAVRSGAHAHAGAQASADQRQDQDGEPLDAEPEDVRLKKVPEVIAPEALNGPFEMAPS